jgi:hypothetical protein
MICPIFHQIVYFEKPVRGILRRVVMLEKIQISSKALRETTQIISHMWGDGGMERWAKMGWTLEK